MRSNRCETRRYPQPPPSGRGRRVCGPSPAGPDHGNHRVRCFRACISVSTGDANATSQPHVQLTKSGGARTGEPLYTDGRSVYLPGRRQQTGSSGRCCRMVITIGLSAFPPDNFVFAVSRPITRSSWQSLSSLQPTVWRIPIAGDSPRRAGNLLADNIAWSHDGSSFACPWQSALPGEGGWNVKLPRNFGSGSRPAHVVPCAETRTR